MEKHRANLPVGHKLISLGTRRIGIAQQTLIDLKRLFRVAGDGILQRAELHEPSHQVETDNSASNLDCFVRIRDGICQPAKLRTRIATAKIELR